MGVRLEGSRHGIRLAYEFIVPSYSWAINRWDAVHGRIDRLLAFSAALVVAAPVLVEALYGDSHESNDALLVGALLAFLSIAVIGLYALKKGDLRLLNLNDLCSDPGWLDCGEGEFQQDLLKSAGEDFDANIDDVNDKVGLEFWMIVLLALEATLLVGWVLR